MKPRCPYCNVVGSDKITGETVAGKAVIIFCSSCGAIHGVVPATKTTIKKDETQIQDDTPQKPQLSGDTQKSPQKEQSPVFRPNLIIPSPKRIQPNDIFVSSIAITVTELAAILTHILKLPIQLTAAQASYMMLDDNSNSIEDVICPKHGYRMAKLRIPKGLPEADKIFLSCPKFAGCQQWRWVELCPECGKNTHRMSIPKGYDNAGKKMIVCRHCQYHKVL